MTTPGRICDHAECCDYRLCAHPKCCGTHVRGDTLRVDITLRVVDTQQLVTVNIGRLCNDEDPGEQEHTNTQHT